MSLESQKAILYKPQIWGDLLTYGVLNTQAEIFLKMKKIEVSNPYNSM